MEDNVERITPPLYSPAEDQRDENGMIDGVQYPPRSAVEQEKYDRWVAAR